MILSAKNISIKYDKEIIIDDESFEIKKGKINVFLGKNGCGKSTLFKSLCKQLNPYSGNIFLNDKNINKIKNKDFAKITSILFQENVAPNDLTVKELVSYGRFPHIGLYSDLDNNDKKIIEDSLTLTNTKQFENRSVTELSSGQRQLVWIAMLLSQNTNIMFFDEPTTYLDLKNQYEVMNCIEKINKELNKTVIIILHDINLAIQYADYIFMMKNGKIKYSGTIDEVIITNNIKDIFDINVSIIKNKGQTFICPLKN